MRVDQELFGTQLPTYLTRFVGRSRELAELEFCIGPGRSVTICGVGGAGKSRLAVELGRRIACEPGTSTSHGRFRDGVCWVSLAQAGGPDSIVRAIAVALGLPEAAGSRPIGGIFNALADQQLLLLVDNCEHLAAACAELFDRIVQLCPGIAIVATSRIGLHASTEIVFPIPPLGLDFGGDAVSMFVDRARLTSPAYELTELNAETIRGICQQLDGLPLAIELAATRIRVLSPKDLAGELAAGSDALASETAPVDRRHQRLASVLDSSWEWLSAQERQVLTALGTFSGGFTRAAAEQVAGATLNTLSALIERALVQRMPDATGGTRYHMHELVRAYAVDRLQRADPTTVEVWCKKHCDYFLDLAEASFATLDTTDEQAALDVLESEAANIEAAIRWAIAAGEGEQALRLIDGVFTFWSYSSPRDWSPALLAEALALPWDESSPTARAARAQACIVAGFSAVVQSDFDAGRRCFADAVSLSEDAEYPRRLAWALRGAGYVERLSGNPALGSRLAAHSLDICREVGDHNGAAWSMYDLGETAFVGQHLDEAMAWFDQADTALAELGITFALCRLEILRSDVHRMRDELVPALDRLRHAIALQQRQHYFAKGGEILEGLAAIAARLRQWPVAATMVGAGEQWRDVFGFPRYDAIQPTFVDTVREIRRRLGPAAYDAAYAEGRSLTAQDAQRRADQAIEELVAIAEPTAGLTVREVEVLRLVSEGLGNAEIADRLRISQRTVDAHLRSIFSKLDVTTRTAAAREAVRLGLA